jgi:Domain of unknown function (DUF305)
MRWALLLLVSAVLAGCGHATPVPVDRSAVTTEASGFNGTDRAWLQLMIPMNEQALPLLDLVAIRPSDEPTRRLAAQVAATYRAELPRLYALRARTGLPTTNVHEGHELPGLVTAEQVRAAERTEGAELGTLVVARVREQLEQGILLCTGERTSGADPATKALAAAIEAARARHLAQLAT